MLVCFLCTPAPRLPSLPRFPTLPRTTPPPRLKAYGGAKRVLPGKHWQNPAPPYKQVPSLQFFLDFKQKIIQSKESKIDFKYRKHFLLSDPCSLSYPNEMLFFSFSIF